ncbi:MAG TPA: PAS domain S-box protein [Spirochaetota bacterium]|nr:PAS domain S-box protein [Spirochaetota bacterium]HPI88081.1 PAS domain S-box protein [Spirochaetota bacterium]HPR46434.1 PAS domain S-box protein [Spirochaetota bacterium]
MSRRQGILNNIISYEGKKFTSDELDKIISSIWSLYSSSPLPTLLLLSGKGKIIKYNRSLHALTGYRKKNTSDFYNWLNQLAPAALNKHKKLEHILESVKNGADVGSDELIIVSRSGEKILCRVSVHNIIYNSRKTGYIVFNLHVSEKWAYLNTDETPVEMRLQEVRNKEETFRAIFNAVNVGMWVCDMVSGEFNINMSLINLLGYKWTELKSVTDITKIIHPEDFHKCLNEYLRHKQEITDRFCMEHRVLHANGRYSWMLTSGKIIERHPSGIVKKIVGTSQDITSIKIVESELRDYRDRLEELVKERTDELLDANEKLYNEIIEHKKLKKDLRDSRQRLELVLKGGDLGFWDYNLISGTIVLDEKWCSLLGFDPTSPSIDIKKLIKLVHPNDKIDVIVAQKRHRAGQDPFYESEHRMYTRDGVWVWVLMKGRIVEYNDLGEPARAAGTLLDITVQKQMEAKLQENEDRYWNLFNNMRNGVSIYDSPDNGETFILKDLNRAGEKIDYVSKDEVIGRELAAVYDSENEIELREIFKRIYETGKPEEKASYLYRDNRIMGWRSSYVYKLPSNEIVLITDDLSEKKFAEEEVKKQQKKYKDLVENINEGICVIDDKSLTKFVSPSMAGMLGYPFEEMLGRPLSAFMSQHYIPIYNIYLRRLEMGVKEHGDFEFVHRNGTLIFTRMESSPLKDSDDNYIGAIVSVMDITEHKRVDDELKKSGRLLSTVFNSMQDQVIVIDPGYKVIVSNIGDQSPWSFGDAGKDTYCYECLMNRDTPCEDCLAVDVFKTGSIMAFERSDFLGGKTFDIRMSPIFDDDGEVVMVVKHLRDITDRKVAEEKIKSSLNEKEFLLKEIHHRVKNNMQIISSMLNLQSRYVNDIRDLDLFRDSQNRVRAMALVHEKLYQSTDLAQIDFSLYIKEFTSYLFYSYNVNPAKIRFELTVENIYFSIDSAIPLAQIINEVISNSLKHAFPGDLTGCIKIVFYREKGKYVLIIRDNGVGFPEGVDFTKAETLGLQLIRALVLQLEGKIEKADVAGTEYIITF